MSNIRVVHGVVNKMDSGRKKFSKKVVRRAVRRADKKDANYQLVWSDKLQRYCAIYY